MKKNKPLADTSKPKKKAVPAKAAVPVKPAKPVKAVKAPKPAAQAKAANAARTAKPVNAGKPAKPQATTTKAGAKKSAPPARRTQAERRNATRQRLVDATLTCLAEDGYAGTTINRIVEKAEVSHGASGHYFPSKAAMIQAAAEELMKQAYRRWGAALLNVTDADDRLDALLSAAWQDVFNTERSDAFIELMQASKKDAELRERLQPMIAVAMKTFRQSAEHFFTAKKDDVDLYDMMILTQWLFRGMAMDQRIARSPAVFEPYLALWKKIMAEHVLPKAGVTTPPPRPA